MKIDDYLTHISRPEDLPFLTTKLFDVNIRLFNSNKYYRQVIEKCCDLITVAAGSEMEGYKKPHGMSGANVGIPFNIIGIVKNRNQDTEYVELMVNPKIVEFGGDWIECKTNCGSIRLEKPIKIKRQEKVCVSYLSFYGGELIHLNNQWFGRADGSLTIQHEIEHNLGILITDFHGSQLDHYNKMMELYYVDVNSKELEELANQYKNKYGEDALKQFWRESDGF